MQNKPIGVFDSGLGGISVLRQLKKQMPNEHFIYFGDSKYAPYGLKDRDTIIKRCIYICDLLLTHEVKAIVIACNTATSVAVDILREKYAIPIIGMEPALKVATKYNEKQRIVVLATPLTLKEEKFERLMEHYQAKHEIIKIPCPQLVAMVENDELDDIDKIKKQIHDYFTKVTTDSIDSIVLGCTHFVFYRQFFQHYFPHSKIIDGNVGTTNHLLHILEQEDMVSKHSTGEIKIFNSLEDAYHLSLSKKLLAKENADEMV